MTSALRPPSVLVAAVAIAGGVAFVGSLGVGVAAYAVWFAAVAEPWSSAAGLPPLAVNAALFTGFAAEYDAYEAAVRWRIVPFLH